MTNLSPQAQAIVDAYDSAPFVDYDIGDRVSIAAVLREAINQLQQSSATHPAFISCPDLLELCEELEKL